MNKLFESVCYLHHQAIALQELMKLQHNVKRNKTKT